MEGYKPKEAIYRDFRAGDIRHSNANIDKLKNATGYESTHNLDKGLNESIKQYIENLK